MQALTLTIAQRIKALGVEYGLKGRALAVFVDEAGDAAYGIQSFEAAYWRIGASRLKSYEEELALNALRKWQTEAATASLHGDMQ